MPNSAFGLTGAFLALPPGAMVDFAGTTAPSGWLMADGSAISRSVYAQLFQAIGVAYGVGDGSTTFNLPDFRGRFARYMDNMGTAAGAASRDTGRVLGAAQTQATAKNGLSNASSSVSASGSTNTAGSHNHTIAWYGNGTGVNGTGTAGGDSGSALGGSSANGVSSAGSHDHTVSVSGTANAQTITGDAETRPINLACHRIIKV